MNNTAKKKLYSAAKRGAKAHAFDASSASQTYREKG
jgi:hypothetical protein